MNDADPFATAAEQLTDRGLRVNAWVVLARRPGWACCDLTWLSATVSVTGILMLPPADLETVVDHVRAVVAAGADELHLYHLGLVNRAQLDRLGELARR